MYEGTEGDRPSNDLQRDNIKDAERQVVAIADAIAPSLVFNAAAFPPNLPDHVMSALSTKAQQDKVAAQEAGFITPETGRPIDGKTLQEREHDKDEENRLYVASIFQEEEERRQHEREEANYQEWRQTRHTYAGQTMDGEDWHRLMNWFRDPANVADWEDAMMRETGQSRDEVRQTGGKMKRFYDLMGKDARGTMTKDERAEFDTLNADKDIKRGVEVQQEIQGLQHSQGHELTARNEIGLDSNQARNAVTYASLMDDSISLTKAAPLTATYKEAALGKPVSMPIAPSNPAPAQTVTVSPDNMFG